MYTFKSSSPKTDPKHSWQDLNSFLAISKDLDKLSSYTACGSISKDHMEHRATEEKRSINRGLLHTANEIRPERTRRADSKNASRGAQQAGRATPLAVSRTMNRRPQSKQRTPPPSKQPPCGTAWPDAPPVPPMTAEPLRLLVWPQYNCKGSHAQARQNFQKACVDSGLNVLRYAQYDVRGDHMILTVTNNVHAQQCRAAPAALQQYVRKALSWHVAFDSIQSTAGNPLSAKQRARPGLFVFARGCSMYVDSAGFTLPRRPLPSARACHADTVPKRRTPCRNIFAALAPDVDVPGHARTMPAPEPRCIAASSQSTTTPDPPTSATSSAHRDVDTAPQQMHIGTWNLRNLNSNATSKLTCLKDFMQHRDIPLLAVQETKLPAQCDWSRQLGLQYFGAPAVRGEKGHNRCGTGFLVQEQFASKFKYIGPKKPLVDGYGAVWGRWQVDNTQQCLWLASVYFPDSARSRRDPALAQAVLNQIKTSYEYFSRQQGTVCLMGDWNAHVGHATNEVLRSDLRPYAPAHGFQQINSPGVSLLELCSELDAFI